MPESQGVKIYTDSKYSINCVTEWYKKWEVSGWQTRSGDVKNRDLVEGIREIIAERDGAGAQTQFVWVKGHSNNRGNVAADHLAVQGAKSR